MTPLADLADALNAGRVRSRDLIETALAAIEDPGLRLDYDGSIFSASQGYENHPMVYVSWYGALEYARFYGKRLPTAAEWETSGRTKFME